MATNHVISLDSVTQRDTLASYLVDVTFSFYDPDGDVLTVSELSWRKGTDPSVAFSAMTPQTTDRKHTVQPLYIAETTPPGNSYNFVWQPFFDIPDGFHDDIYIKLIIRTPVLAEIVEVIEGPFTISTEQAPVATGPLTKQLQRRSIIARTSNQFLGSGLITPFRRASKDFASGSEIELIRANVRQTLGTMAAFGEYAGELPWRPNFGSKLWVLRHRSNDPTLRAQARIFVDEALQWEPRVRVTEVVVENVNLENANEVRIKVRYNLVTTNTTENQTLFPQEFEDTVSFSTAA